MTRFCSRCYWFYGSKNESCLAYSSQFYDPKVTNQKHLLRVKILQIVFIIRAKDLGRLIGVESAEGFTTERYVAVENLVN